MKPKLILVEGCQGVGKTTITNLLRDTIPYTCLMRLSGIQDTTLEGRKPIYDMHRHVLDMYYDSKGIINWIQDRSFMSERVYCMLGFKEYTFEQEYRELLNYLGILSSYYDVYLVLLTANSETLKRRLQREKPEYSKVSFNVDNSLKQQNAYLQLFDEIHGTGISRIIIPTDTATPIEIINYIKSCVNLEKI